MNTKRIGFIGGGRIRRIFLEGWKRQNVLPTKIIVSDCNAETLGNLKARFPGIETAPGNSGVAASQEIVFLAVHPPVMVEVAAGFGLSDAEIAPALKRMVCGGTRTLLESGLSPDEVMDLIPVKPLAEMEPQVAEMYRTRLPGIYQKIKP
jgi:hypothetical protein